MNFFFIFILGLCFGSFINVLIYRVPIGLSILTSSQCVYCKKKILIFDNIPVLSFLLLKGRARCCGKKIKIQYPIVEFIFALSFIYSFYFSDDIFNFIFLSIFFFILMTIFFIDWQHLIIPHVFSWSLIAIGLIYNFIFNQEILDYLFGAILGALLVLITNGIYYVTKKKQGMGMGDVFLLSGIGGCLGLVNCFISFFWASILATFYIIFSGQLSNLQAKIAFGSFLCLAAASLMILNNFYSLSNFFY